MLLSKSKAELLSEVPRRRKKKKKLMYLIQVSERTILHKDKGIKKRATVKSYFPNHVTSQKTKSRK